MLIGKKEFLAGVLMATLSVSATSQLTSLYAVENKICPEVEFSQKVGLFDSESLSEVTLKSNIAEIAFYRGLNLILVDKGIVKNFNTDNLESLGITSTQSPMHSITRQKAAETILRALIYAENRGMIKTDAKECTSFKDWKVSEKYSRIMAFAQSKGVIRGVGENNFNPAKKMTVREALNFLKRVYELEFKAVDFGEAKEGVFAPAVEPAPKTTNIKTVYAEPDLTKFFKDISITNPMANTIKKLINAGAFDQTNLNKELNLTKSIKITDLGAICKGMLAKVQKTDLYSEIDKIILASNAGEAASRNTVAEMGSVLSRVYLHKEYNIKTVYTDVVANSAVDLALKELAKCGIRMGYGDGTFKGSEKVSRYEAFNLFNAIVGDNVDTKIKIKEIDMSKPLPKAALMPAIEKPAVEKPAPVAPKAEAKKTTKVSKSSTISKMEQQLSNDYAGLSFKERIEMRKAQFHKILNRESTR